MRGKKLCSLVLAAVVLATGVPASATSIKSIQNEKAKNESELKNIQSKISGIESQKSALSSEVSSLYDDLTDTLLNIQILESDRQIRKWRLSRLRRIMRQRKRPKNSSTIL